jgi:hypothetical protein
MSAPSIWSDHALLPKQQLIKVNAIYAKTLAEARGLKLAGVNRMPNGVGTDAKIMRSLFDREPFQVGIKLRPFGYRDGSLLGTRHRIGPLLEPL